MEWENYDYEAGKAAQAEMANDFKSVINGVTSTVASVTETAKGYADTVGKASGQVASYVSGKAATYGRGIAQPFAEVAYGVEQNAKTLGHHVHAAAGHAVDSVEKGVTDVAAGATGAVAGAVNGVATKVAEASAGTQQAASNAQDAAQSKYDAQTRKRVQEMETELNDQLSLANSDMADRGYSSSYERD